MPDVIKSFRCNFNVKYNGSIYRKDELIELNEADAIRLMRNGAIRDDDVSPDIDTDENELPENVASLSSAPDESVDKDTTSQNSLIANAIVAMDKSNASLWLKSGKPDASELSKIVGFDVSAALRDAIWDDVNNKEEGE